MHLSSGDLALVRGPRPYLLADHPDRPPGAVIEPGQICRTADGETQTFSSEEGLRTWGNDADGETVMLTGVYELDTQIGGHVVELLPEVAHLPGLADAPVTTLLGAELGSDAVGQDVIVDRLPAEVSVSRATLARRFTDVVGRSPISYLTHWRLDRAADLLSDPGATVGSVAAAVGYGTPLAFSTAFKRRCGVSPAGHRADRRLD